MGFATPPYFPPGQGERIIQPLQLNQTAVPNVLNRRRWRTRHEPRNAVLFWVEHTCVGWMR